MGERRCRGPSHRDFVPLLLPGVPDVATRRFPQTEERQEPVHTVELVAQPGVHLVAIVPLLIGQPPFSERAESMRDARCERTHSLDESSINSAHSREERGASALHPTKNTDWNYNEIDTAAPNSSHSLALAMVGYNQKVLELGCAGGHVTRALNKQACRVTGIEIDPESAMRASAFAEDVLTADLCDLSWADKLEPQQFDVVLAGDVLEHLTDPLRVLRACRGVLKPDGRLVVSLPNIAHADARLALLQGRFEYRPWGLLDDSHLRFYTKETADQLLRDAGFVPVETNRVIVPVFDSEVELDRDAVSDSVLRQVLQDPEAETYQFVISAALDTGDVAVRGLSARNAELDEQLMLERTKSAVLESQVHELRSRLGHAEAQWNELLGTRTFRYLAPLRRLYGELRDRQ
jgi:2-polyprenyl-3-methyl-5-hydroxy-6-metoxy-1,4-benzoquinol methylase